MMQWLTSRGLRTGDAAALSELKFIELVHDGHSSVVVRAVRRSDGRPLVAKLPAAGRVAARDRARYWHEFSLAHRGLGPHVVHAEQLIDEAGAVAILFEDVHAESLASRIARRPLAVGELLSVGADIARALAALHEHGIVHRDINPSNVVRSGDGSRVQVIDLGIALDTAATGRSAPRMFEGTPAYTSPEQTGRFNRAVDHRADLYGLGATLFELATGRVPFAGTSLAELFHAHIAVSPPSLNDIRGDLPPAFEQIVRRLMQKSPERRYQTAEGVLWDLERLVERESLDVIGQRDFPGEPNWSVSLHGRGAERAALLDALDECVDGAMRFVTICGSSGIGKSALVGELQAPVVERHGHLVEGKFDQFGMASAAGGVAMALRGMVHQMLALPPDALAQHRQQLADSLGSSARALAPMVPEIEALLPDAPPLDVIDGAAAGHRLRRAVRALVGSLASETRPLVLFIDDVQWADAASLGLLESLFDPEPMQWVMVLLAWRHNEVLEGHPLDALVHALRSRGLLGRELQLQPLSVEDSTLLLAEALRSEQDDVSALARGLHDRTNGNPLFILQGLRQLWERGAVRLDRAQAKWSIDVDAIHDVGMPGDVLSLLVQRMHDLTPETRRVLALGGMLGAAFSIGVVVAALDESPGQVVELLEPAIKRGLLVSDSSRLRAEVCAAAAGGDGLWSLTVRFVHDRVQQAAVAQPDDDERLRLHHALGRALRARCADAPDDDQVLDAAHHLSAGAALLDPSECDDVARFVLDASRRAAAATAFGLARELTDAARALACDGAATDDCRLAFDIDIAALEYHVLSGAYADADELASRLEGRAAEHEMRVRLWVTRMDQFLLEGRYREAVETANTGLAALGWPLPESDAACEAELDRLHDEIDAIWAERDADGWLEHARLDASDDEAAIRLAYGLFLAAYLSGLAHRPFVALALMARVSLERGHAPLSAYGFVGYGMVLTLVRQAFEHGAAFADLGVRLADRLGDAGTGCKAHFLYAADVQSWTRPLRMSIPHYERAWELAMSVGDWLTVGYVVMQSGADWFTMGRPLGDFIDTWTRHLALLKRTSNDDAWELCHAGSVWAAHQLRAGVDPRENGYTGDFDPQRFLARHADNPFYHAWLYSSQIVVAWHLGLRDTWRTWIERLAVVEANIPSHANKVPSATCYAALMAIEFFDRDADADMLDTARRLRGRLAVWASACRENVGAMLALVDGELARVEGNVEVAAAQLDQAIELATTHDLLPLQAVAWERSALLHRRAGAERMARTLAENACECLTRWDATAVIERFERDWAPWARRGWRSMETPSTITAQTTMRLRADQVIDAAVVRRASEAISSEIDTRRLVERLLEVVMTHAGAQYGALVVLYDDEARLRAIAKSQDGVRILDEPLESPDVGEQVAVSVARFVLRTRRALLETELALRPPWSDDDHVRAQRPRSLLATPLITGGEVHGALILEHYDAEGTFTEDHLGLLSYLSSSIASALVKARLYDELNTYRDHLAELVEQRTRELKTVLTDLEAAQDELVRKGRLAALGSMVAGVAHELNTPLAVVSTALTVMEREFDALLPERDPSDAHVSRVARAYQLATRNAQRAARLVQSFKALGARVAAESLQTASISRLIRDVVTLHRPRLDSLALDIVVSDHLDGASDTIRCDVDRMTTVILNLFENAGRHGYEGRGGQVRASIRRDNGSVVIVVEDDGRGMPPDVQHRCFDPFYSTDRQGDGMGLGLAIVHSSIVDELGGKLNLRSEPGRGARFTLHLPVASATTD